MEKAERLSDSVAVALFTSLDSVRRVAETNKDFLFFVFNQYQMVYWSDSWLSGKEISFRRGEQWYYQHFDNAHCLCRWKSAGNYRLLTVIPIKYDFAIQNEQLHNAFISPFRGNERLELTTDRRKEYESVLAPDGHFLFSVYKSDKETNSSLPRLESFTFEKLIYNVRQPVSDKVKVRIYYVLEIMLFVVMLILGAVALYRVRGWNNLSIRAKISFIIISIFLGVTASIFAITTYFVRKQYEQRQQQLLLDKSMYIQKSLQVLYLWDVGLSERNERGMNIDLKDMSQTYEVDILVYTMDGALVGSSVPELFETGLLSSRMATEPFFSNVEWMLLKQHTGDMEYLCSYVKFYNGQFYQIGYIAVPLFISADEVDAEVDAYLARLFPPSLIVLLIILLVSYFWVRNLTKPIRLLSEQMKHFRIDEPHTFLAADSTDEIGQLTERYNEMIVQLEKATEKMVAAEREAAWKVMARQIVHEINNVLTPMKLTLQQLVRAKSVNDERFEPYFDKATRTLIEQIDTLAHIAGSFSTFAKMPDVVVQQVDVAQKLTSVITLFRHESGGIPIRYIGVEQGVSCQTDPEQISQVFNNLLKNALQALENKKDGDIIIKLEEKETEVLISVSDNGAGIPDEVKNRIFLPNFTTKAKGTGLGLAISKNIVEQSGGKIWFESKQNDTTFYVLLKK